MVKGPNTYEGENYVQATFRMRRACHIADGQHAGRSPEEIAAVQGPLVRRRRVAAGNHAE